ncbi:MAG: FAD:protein FMN transferase [Verrucomicrobiales bacterium]
MRERFLLFSIGVWVLIGGTSGCEKNPRAPEHVLDGAAMGTTWSLRYSGSEMGELDRRVADRLEELEAIFSTWREGSLVSQLNRGDEPPLPQDYTRLARLAGEMRERTGGIFDVALGESVEAAGFGSGLGGRLDYSGIAKGYAVDEIGSLLESLGVEAFLFELGGELLGRGPRDWRVGLEAPDPGSVGRSRRVISLRNQAVATSGVYRLFRGDQNHLIDPRSRRPVAGDCVSVSVVADTCAEADASATALMVLGVEAGSALARRLGLHAYFVERLADGSLVETGPDRDSPPDVTR